MKMSEKLTHCDKCLSEIIDGFCTCGVWYDKGHHPEPMKIMERAITAYNFSIDQRKINSIFSGDHHSGTSIILFKGDYKKCMKVVEFIEGLE